MQTADLKLDDNTIYICAVGTSPNPIIYNIKEHQPKNIIYVVSKDTQKIMIQVQDKINSEVKNQMVIWEKVQLDNPDELVSCVKNIRSGINEFLKKIIYQKIRLFAETIQGAQKQCQPL